MTNKGWYGQKQRHSMASKGIKSSIIVDERSGMWFESNGINIDVITLNDNDNNCLFSNGIGKGEAKGYSQKEYVDDASMIVIMPSSKAEESIEWLDKEYAMARTPQRKAQLERLIKMTLNRIRLELNMTEKNYMKGQLIESYKMYENMLNNIKDKQRRIYA